MCTGWLIFRSFFRVSMLNGLIPREMVRMFSMTTANWNPMGIPKNLSFGPAAGPSLTPKAMAGTLVALVILLVVEVQTVGVAGGVEVADKINIVGDIAD